MSDMIEQFKIDTEMCGVKFLRIMQGESFSLAQKATVIEFIQKKLFPPIKLMVEGELKEIPSAQVMEFESQFAEFEECCMKNCKCSVREWVKNAGSDESIAETLRNSYLGYLATPEWIAFLRNKLKLDECSLAA